MPGRSNFDADDLIQRYIAGESLNSLCKLYRTDRTTIHEVLDEHGMKPRGRREATGLATLADLDSADLIHRYMEGESLHTLSSTFGVDRYVIRRVLREGGANARTAAESRRLTRTVHLDETAVVRRYMAGESAKTLATAYGCGDRAIYRVLRENGVTPRTITEAANLVLDQLTLAQRQARATKHVIVWEGRSYPSIPATNPEWLRKNALTRQRTLSQQRPEELRVLAALPEGWVDGQQVAVDRYNIDFTHGPVAVEVHSSGLHAVRSEKAVSRAVELAHLGWHTIYFWPNSGYIRRFTDRGIGELVAHAERLNCDPAVARQYLVVRGGGEVVTAGHFDLDQRALIPAAVDRQELADRG